MLWVNSHFNINNFEWKKMISDFRDLRIAPSVENAFMLIISVNTVILNCNFFPCMILSVHEKYLFYIKLLKKMKYFVLLSVKLNSINSELFLLSCCD